MKIILAIIFVFFVSIINAKLLRQSFNVYGKNKQQKLKNYKQAMQKVMIFAQKNNLKIKKIQIGKNIQKYLSQKIKKKQLNELIRKLSSEQIKQSLGQQKKSYRKLENEYIQKAKNDPTSKLNIMPGSSGMPFPPFYFDGPHFHAPVTVTQNSISNKFKKQDLNPFPRIEYEFKDDRENIREIKSYIDQTYLKLEQMPSKNNIIVNDLSRLYRVLP